MHEDVVESIIKNPDFQTLVMRRKRLAWSLSVAVLVVYFSFILTIAFEPALLATPLSEGSVISVGIPIGIFIIIFAFVMTGIYTKRANSEFDALSKKIKEAHQ